MEKSLLTWKLHRKNIIFANCEKQLHHQSEVVSIKQPMIMQLQHSKNRMTDIRRELYTLVPKGESAEVEQRGDR